MTDHEALRKRCGYLLGRLKHYRGVDADTNDIVSFVQAERAAEARAIGEALRLHREKERKFGNMSKAVAHEYASVEAWCEQRAQGWEEKS